MTEDFNKSLKKEYHKDLFGIILFPALITAFSILLFILFLIPTIKVCRDGGNIVYNDSAAVSYRDTQYAKYFDSTNKQNGLLIVYLIDDVNSKYDQYLCISKVGENVVDKIRNEFGIEGSSFGKSVLKEIDKYYEETFGDDIIAVMNTMSKEITDHGLVSSFKDTSLPADISVSRVINHTPLAISNDMINDALDDFSEETGLPVVIVIDSLDNVFDRQLPFRPFFIMVILLGVIAFCVYNTTKKVILRVRYEYHPELFVQKSIYDKDDEDGYDTQQKSSDAEFTDKTDTE